MNQIINRRFVQKVEEELYKEFPTDTEILCVINQRFHMVGGDVVTIAFKNTFPKDDKNFNKHNRYLQLSNKLFDELKHILVGEW